MSCAQSLLPRGNDMDVLLSTEITPAMLISTTAPERLPGQVEWSDQAWTTGSVVTRTSTRRVYKAAFDVPSGGVPPEENIAVAMLPYWVDIAPMNQWAMFDGLVKTRTEGPGPLQVVLRPGPISSLWLGNMDNASRAEVVYRSSPGGPVVFDKEFDLSALVGDWEEYWFAPFLEQGDLTVNGIPSYNMGELNLTIESGGDVGVGMSALGSITRLGKTQWDPEADFRNYSARTLDTAQGPTGGTGGAVTRDVTYSVVVEPEDAPRVTRFLEQAMGRPGVWIPHGDPRFEGIRVFGQAISARLRYPAGICILSLTIRGFI